mmetsp:Transcript_83388/g.236578  ORF Transcript_83388/g.236578 Transcript_83388/m.236578 type:complete len:202 (-) Transcript_83388:9-614(-)
MRPHKPPRRPASGALACGHPALHHEAARVPLDGALLLHAVPGRGEVLCGVRVAVLQVADVRGGAVDLDRLVAALALDPRRCRPLADAPGGLARGAQLLLPFPVVAVRPAPVLLAREVPEAGARDADLRADAVGGVVVAPAVPPNVPGAGAQGRGGRGGGEGREHEESQHHGLLQRHTFLCKGCARPIRICALATRPKLAPP